MEGAQVGLASRDYERYCRQDKIESYYGRYFPPLEPSGECALYCDFHLQTKFHNEGIGLGFSVM